MAERIVSPGVFTRKKIYLSYTGISDIGALIGPTQDGQHLFQQSYKILVSLKKSLVKKTKTFMFHSDPSNIFKEVLELVNNCSCFTYWRIPKSRSSDLGSKFFNNRKRERQNSFSSLKAFKRGRQY